MVGSSFRLVVCMYKDFDDQVRECKRYEGANGYDDILLISIEIYRCLWMRLNTIRFRDSRKPLRALATAWHVIWGSRCASSRYELMVLFPCRFRVRPCWPSSNLGLSDRTGIWTLVLVQNSALTHFEVMTSDAKFNHISPPLIKSLEIEQLHWDSKEYLPMTCSSFL